MKNRSNIIKFDKANVLILLIILTSLLHSQTIETIIKKHSGLAENQKYKIIKHIYYFSDNVFIAEKISSEKKLLNNDIIDAVLLESGNSLTIAKSLYYSFLTLNQNSNIENCFSLAIPLSFSKIEPYVFLEYINFFNYLKQIGVKQQNAIAIILYLNYSRTTPQQLLNHKNDFIKLITNKHENYIIDYIVLKKSQLKINTPGKFNNWLKSNSGKKYNKFKTYLMHKYGEKYSQNIINTLTKTNNKQTDKILSIELLSEQLEELDKVNIPPDLALKKLKKHNTISTIKNDREIKEITSTIHDRKKNMMSRIKSFIGTPYRWGGNTRNGTDCSGFVQTIMAEMGVKIPRTAQGQINIGKTISKQNLQFGDLVFFATSGNHRVTHVGIYIGNNKFVHASSSNGVRSDNLSNRYYQKRFINSKRILKL